jgi:hypothetical protein
MASKTSIKFTTGMPYQGRVYYQPLFYLAENTRQMSKKTSGREIDIKKLDTDLVILGQPKLEVGKFNNNREKDICISFYLNQADNIFEFTYKGVEFGFRALECKNFRDRMIPEKRDDIQMYSEYEISFASSNQEEFETFIKTCITYYNTNSHGDNEDKEKISIYLSSTEGGYLQYLGKRQKRDMDSLYLPKKQKADIIADMEKFLAPATRERYMKLGINHKRVYLLEGIPGSGKTSLITALASKFNFSIAIVSFVPKMTDVDLLRIMRSLNDTYEENSSSTDSDESQKKQTIMIFEDIDCIFKERKSNDENKNSITFSGLLNALDGITSNENLICFITTNYKNHLDSALLRPGRIDYIMRFDYSTKEQIQDMFRDFTSCKDAGKIQEFYKACADLQIKICTALLQQYLMQYMDQPDEAISNVDKMKKMYENVKVNKEADETNLYG